MKQDKIISYFVIPIILFLIATAIFYLNIFNKLLFPHPLTILKAFIILISSQKMYSDIILTLTRVMLATILSIVIGIPIGLILGHFKKIYNTFEFIIDFSRSIPATALFPLFILFFGIGDTSKIMLGAWVVTFVIIINTSYGVMHANKAYLKIAKIYKTSKTYILRHIIYPGALPHIFSGLRVGVSLGLIVIIVTEMFVGSVNGLGNAILNAQLMYKIPEMYALIIITGILGYLLNKLFLIIEKRTIHWTN